MPEASILFPSRRPSSPRYGRVSSYGRSTRAVVVATLALVSGLRSANAKTPAVAPTASSQAPRYLDRPTLASPWHLDHGVLAVEAVGAWPYRYAVGVGLGLADHLTLGVRAHWLAGFDRPQVSPSVDVAFYRGPRWELGARYFVGLGTPSERLSSVPRRTFLDRDQFALATFTVGQGYWAAGLDVGYLRTLEPDPYGIDAEPPPLRTAHRLAAGLHARFGSRRIGLRAAALWPVPLVELALDLRFDLFARRTQGGWWDPGTP